MMTVMGTMMISERVIWMDGGFDGVDDNIDRQAKEEESREQIGSHLDEEKSIEVQGMVNRLTFLKVVVSYHTFTFVSHRYWNHLHTVGVTLRKNVSV